MLVNKTFQGIITFTRASAATRINSSGVMESVAANVPRIDYDPITLAVNGLLIEEQRTNMLLNSPLDGTPLSTQSISVTAVPHTLSFYGSGTVALSGAYTGSVAGTGVYPARKSLTFTPAAGTLTLTVTGDVKFAQCEQGGFATSFIPTAGTQVTRAIESANINTLSPWYSSSEGTLYVEARGVGSGSMLPAAVSLDDSTSANRTTIRMNVASDSATLINSEGGTNWASINFAGGWPNGTTKKLAAAYKKDDVAFSVGGAILTDTSSNNPVVTRLTIGGGASSNLINGHIKKVKYWPKRLTNAELQALTA